MDLLNAFLIDKDGETYFVRNLYDLYNLIKNENEDKNAEFQEILKQLSLIVKITFGLSVLANIILMAFFVFVSK